MSLGTKSRGSLKKDLLSLPRAFLSVDTISRKLFLVALLSILSFLKVKPDSLKSSGHFGLLTAGVEQVHESEAKRAVLLNTSVLKQRIK